MVVSVTELRDELARISKGLSWERTIEDLASALTNDPILQHLNSCRQVVIAFSADGSLWLDNGPTKDSSLKAHLVYDPASIEGQWAEQSDGEVFGFLSCMVPAITRALVHQLHAKSEQPEAHEQTAVGTDEHAPDFTAAMRSGLAAMRDLRRKGHGRVCEVAPNGYPVKRLANVLFSPADYSVGERYSACLVPWQKVLSAKSDGCSAWSIAVQAQLPDKGGDFVTMPMSGLAQEFVRRGRHVLASLPHATFGGLFTIDRSEIETLRTLRRLMKDYKQEKQASKPLSIGVFGPPGAGKSFGVKQIAKEIFG